MADVILTAEKDRQDADALFRFVHFEPIHSPIERQMSKTLRQIIVTITTIERRTQLVGLLPDIVDAVVAITQCSLYAHLEASVTLTQRAKDQGEIVLGFRRKLNSELHERGACR